MALFAETIVTNRLTLVPLVVGDAEAMMAVFDDDRMYEFTGGRPPTLGELRSRYEQLVVGRSADESELWFNWIVRTSTDSEAVGVLQATVDAAGRHADVAWEVGVRWQGRRIASEAAAAVVAWLIEHDVVVISASIHPDHRASAGVAARAGLQPTAEVDDGEVVWRRDVVAAP